MAKFIVYSLRAGQRSVRGYFTPTWTPENLLDGAEDVSSIPTTAEFLDGTIALIPRSKVFTANCFYDAIRRCWRSWVDRGLFVYQARSSTDTHKIYLNGGTYYVAQLVAP